MNPLPPTESHGTDANGASGQQNVRPTSIRERLIHHPFIRKLLLRQKASLTHRFTPFLLGTPLTTAEIGIIGEHMARQHLREKGRRILYRNFRGSSRGEVDIVARHRDVLTFVEVKTRTSSAFGRPADAVNADKRRLIQAGAMAWMRKLNNPRIKFRFDIQEVLLIPGELPQLHMIENAFQMSDSSMAGR